ncbi:hypothetical protein SLS53_001374 [Cytospora paraplurivora]|uniref:Uncharacterized protein n=1 Tax=Cytospora paraplurivora TaxID=2898453 RepID=A0AAN9UKC5_9PEZI
MYNFLCTIRDRPDLGRLVKAVFLDISDLADEAHTNEQHSQLVQERIIALGLFGRYAHRMVERQTGRRKYETLAQVIIAHLSGIEKLHLETPETATDIFGVFDDIAGTRRQRIPPQRPANVVWPQLKQCASLHTHHPLNELVQLLKSYHKDTLRRLQLGGAYPSEPPSEVPELRQLPALEELRIHSNCIPLPRDGEIAPREFPLASILPISIRRFHINFASHLHVPQLVRLANESQQPYMVREHPHLREVTVMYQVRGDGDDLIDDGILDDPDDSLTQVDLDLLQSAFSQTDISFSAKARDGCDWDIDEF